MIDRAFELDAEAILRTLSERGVMVRGLSADSRSLRAGDVFVAAPGLHVDGRDYISQAISAGAAAVVWEAEGYTWSDERDIPNVAVKDLRKVVGALAHVVYRRPSNVLWTLGVTGTNGKTSVSQWIARAFIEANRKCGVVGTLGLGLPGALRESANTTPDAITLHCALSQLVDAGAQAVAMEVSSIGLDQERVAGVHFDVAVFTNLTRDHLEYHQTMQAYGAAKARLFATPGLRHAVINLDDPFGLELSRSLAGKLERIGYTCGTGFNAPNDADILLRASNIDVSGSALRFHVETSHERAEVHAYLVGLFNVSNLLAVIGALIASGFSLEEAAQLTHHLTPPPGRMQILGGVGEPLVVVDYAHTPDALEQVLKALRPSAEKRGGRLVCVFGCGGDRDAGKRAPMGEIAARLADVVVVTSDNPRSEDPQAIIDQVVAGAGAGVKQIVDRAQAIAAVIADAKADDVVVIAGKGHEGYQEIAGVRQDFSDLTHARAALAQWERRLGA